jgi:hypothetical protein
MRRNRRVIELIAKLRHCPRAARVMRKGKSIRRLTVPNLIPVG